MGRYDGPDFETGNEHLVSVWAATRPLEEIPDDYFEENYGGEDDEPFNAFSEDFGFGLYDHDFVETYCTDDWQTVDIAELIDPLSYSASFRDQVIRRAEDLQLSKTCYVFLLYKFKYDPQLTGIEQSDHMRFLGAFPYSDEE